MATDSVVRARIDAATMALASMGVSVSNAIRLPHRRGRVEQGVAHRRRSRLPVPVDERLQLPQMMGVAESVVDLVEGGVGAEMVVHDTAALQFDGNVAAPLADPVDRMGLARRRLQPLRLAGDPEAGLVEAAGPGRSDAGPDRAINARQGLRLAPHPRHDAGRTDERRAEQVLKRLRRPVPRQKLLDVEIDRRRADGSPYRVGEITPSANPARVTPRQ
jgi:hypothetical protein